MNTTKQKEEEEVAGEDSYSTSSPTPSTHSSSQTERHLEQPASQLLYHSDHSQTSPHDAPARLEAQQQQQASPESEKDPFQVAWDGGDADPLNPRSASIGRKYLITIIVSLGSFFVTGASSLYTSSYDQMEAEFGNSRIVSTLGLSSFVLGLSIGPMLLGPLSEFYGRRIVYLCSWTLFLLWLIPSAVAQNIETLIITRFFAGFSGSTFLAVSGGTVGDLFTKEQLQFPMAIYSITPCMGPAIAPVVGGFIDYNTDWRWSWYVWIMVAFVMLLAIIFFVPETYNPIALRNKARQVRKQTGDERYRAPTEKVEKSLAQAIGRSLLRPFQLLFLEFMVFNLCILTSLILAVIYLFFGAFPLVLTKVYGFNLWQNGLTFVCLGIGMVLATLSDPVWTRVRRRLMSNLERETGVAGASEPEFRLPSVIVGTCSCTIGLFLFGWSAFPSVHWIVPLIGGSFFGLGFVLSFTGIFTFLVDAYPTYAASALAANCFVRCLFAAAFPLFGNQMYEKLGIHWASSLLGFLMLAMCPFPYIFFKYGKRIRARSRYAKA